MAFTLSAHSTIHWPSTETTLGTLERALYFTVFWSSGVRFVTCQSLWVLKDMSVMITALWAFVSPFSHCCWLTSCMEFAVSLDKKFLPGFRIKVFSLSFSWHLKLVLFPASVTDRLYLLYKKAVTWLRQARCGRCDISYIRVVMACCGIHFCSVIVTAEIANKTYAASIVGKCRSTRFLDNRWDMWVVSVNSSRSVLYGAPTKLSNAPRIG